MRGLCTDFFQGVVVGSGGVRQQARLQLERMWCLPPSAAQAVRQAGNGEHPQYIGDSSAGPLQWQWHCVQVLHM
jgi:hypothetical protein